MGITVCGIGVITSIGVGIEENLDSLLSQRCGISAVSLLDTALSVPVGEIKYSNAELKNKLGIDIKQTVSRTALLGAIAVREAISKLNLSGKRVGLISSTSVGGMDLSENFYKDYIKDGKRGRLRNIIGHDCASSTEFIASYCGITGFRTTISTACSSAANAVIMGAGMLESGMLDYVIVGGVDSLCAFTINGFNSLMILDSELCRPLDKDRKGLNLGEGAGYIVLTKDTNCKAGICMLSGYANANDAFHQTASSENGEGAYLSMTRALLRAGISSDCINYINLHGTGTMNNDSSEMAAVKRIYADNIPAYSSTKGFTGHTLAAAGGVEAVYSVLSIINGVRFANLRFNDNSDIDIFPIIETQKGLDIKHVMSNSFGFGGNCSSLIFSAL